MSSTLYLTPTINHWACDIEADELLEKATTIFCVCVVNVLTKVELTFTDKSSFLEWRKSQPEAIFVGHNFLAYDAPMLNRHWDARIPVTKVVDTFVLSQVFNPGYAAPPGCSKGGHSLEAWGIRLRYPKGDFHDFTVLSDTMVRYCRRDTRLAGLLFVRLTERMLSIGFTERGLEIEHLAWNIIQNKQKRHGFELNKQAAEELYVQLRDREEALKNDIYKLWPPRLEIVGTYKRGRKQDGTYSAGYLKHRGQYPVVSEVRLDGGYDVSDYVAFNLGSPDQRIEKLLELGWEPTEWNVSKKTKERTSPKVDEDALLTFAETSGREEVAKLAKWIVTNSRANMIRTWLDAYNPETGAIHGSLFLAGTLRYKHSKPNSANIPAVRLKKVDGEDTIQYGEDGGYSYESRDLFWCGDPAEFDLVGIDGTGIQNRCLIHSLIKTVGEEAVKDFKALALEGDVHKRNIEILGLANKAAAKKFYYTLMMGGGGARLAADQVQFGTRMSDKEGDAKKRKLIKSIPGFHELIKALKDELEDTGRIKLCDGTPILVSSPHMVIPYLLQGDESRLMKQAMIYLDEEIRRDHALDMVWKVADIHDEWQYKTRTSYTQRLVDLALPCFVRAGESFDYNIAITGDAKVGKTWAETH